MGPTKGNKEGITHEPGYNPMQPLVEPISKPCLNLIKHPLETVERQQHPLRIANYSDRYLAVQKGYPENIA